jgi:hypothetical protein
METISIHTNGYVGSPEMLKNAMDVLCEVALKAFDGNHTGNVFFKPEDKGEFIFEGILVPIGGSNFNPMEILIKIEGSLKAFYLYLEATTRDQSGVTHTIEVNALPSRPIA